VHRIAAPPFAANLQKGPVNPAADTLFPFGHGLRCAPAPVR
jgi:hypothetical protein